MIDPRADKLLVRIQELLDQSPAGRGRLRVLRDASHVEDEWLYAVVGNGVPGMGAAQYSKYLSDIERKLREEDHAKVLLVPAINDVD